MEIRPFEPGDIPAAARLFAERYADLRAGIPELPAAWEQVQRVTGLIDQLMVAGPGLAAREGDDLRGYLGGWIIGEGAHSGTAPRRPGDDGRGRLSTRLFSPSGSTAARASIESRSRPETSWSTH